ncbi:hypothetical protein ACLOJK_009901 [Asimina triloba]
MDSSYRREESRMAGVEVSFYRWRRGEELGLFFLLVCRFSWLDFLIRGKDDGGWEGGDESGAVAVIYGRIGPSPHVNVKANGRHKENDRFVTLFGDGSCMQVNSRAYALSAISFN